MQTQTFGFTQAGHLCDGPSTKGSSLSSAVSRPTIDKRVPKTPRLTSHTKSRVIAGRSHTSIFSSSTESEKHSGWSSAAATVGACGLLLFSAVEPAQAARLSLPLTDVTYQEQPCAKGEALIGRQGSASCLVFTGTVKNPDKQSINNADVFGRVYDKAGNGVTDIEENNRIAYIDEIPSGTSQVSFNLTVSSQQLKLGDLSWQNLKAAGFTGKVLPGQAGQLGLKDARDCEAIGPDSDPFDIEECENQAAENLIR